MWTERVIDAIENASILDRPANATAAAVNSVLPAGWVKDALSGTWFGHAVHPALVTVPLGAWASVSWLDLVGGPGSRRAAQQTVGLGTLAAIPAALTGTSDWGDVAGAERRVGFVHALANCAALGLYATSWQSRRRDRHRLGAGFALLGAGMAGISGWLGGHLSYATGVGVDTTAFLAGPTEWTDVAAEGDLIDDTPIGAYVGKVPVLLLRHGGQLHALNGRCTHRGAPLHEGSLVDDCIECPWHGSRFRLADGGVARGPATRPQPAFEIRTEAGRVLVRQVGEQRALRLNPVGSGSSPG